MRDREEKKNLFETIKKSYLYNCSSGVGSGVLSLNNCFIMGLGGILNLDNFFYLWKFG